MKRRLACNRGMWEATQLVHWQTRTSRCPQLALHTAVLDPEVKCPHCSGTEAVAGTWVVALPRRGLALTLADACHTHHLSGHRDTLAGRPAHSTLGSEAQGA